MPTRKKSTYIVAQVTPYGAPLRFLKLCATNVSPPIWIDDPDSALPFTDEEEAVYTAAAFADWSAVKGYHYAYAVLEVETAAAAPKRATDGKFH